MAINFSCQLKFPRKRKGAVQTTHSVVYSFSSPLSDSSIAKEKLLFSSKGGSKSQHEVHWGNACSVSYFKKLLDTVVIRA